MTTDTPQSCSPLDALLSPRFFRALSDPTRLSMLCELCTCCEPRTVGQIGECLPISISVVSRHLAMLRDAGVLVSEKRGKEVYYRVRYEAVSSLLRRIADALDACCGSANAGCAVPGPEGESDVERP